MSQRIIQHKPDPIARFLIYYYDVHFFFGSGSNASHHRLGTIYRTMNTMYSAHIETFENYPAFESVLSLLAARDIPLCVWEQVPHAHQKSLYPDSGRFRYLFIAPKALPFEQGRDPFEVLEKHMFSCRNWQAASELTPGFRGRNAPAFLGGFIAAIAHEACRFLERIESMQPHPLEPDMLLLQVTEFLVWDQVANCVHYIRWSATPGTESEYAALLRSLDTTNLQTPHISKEPHSQLDPSRIEMKHSKAEFVDLVLRAKEYIVAGDIFQVVLANSFRGRTPHSAHELYQILRQANPSPYHFLVQHADIALVGASPELMLLVEAPSETKRARRTSMRLVAGTYPRTVPDAIPDMRADPKEHAEHVMLVDHVRNDIGRVATTASVRVDDLCAIETYKDVHHLVSQVSGELDAETTSIDVLRATFPIATLSGTPKIRALEILTELEQQPRGFFGGTVALLGYNGFLESSVTIRSAVLQGDEVRIYAGAGIVYDSVAEREFTECLWKAQALLEQLTAGEPR